MKNIKDMTEQEARDHYVEVQKAVDDKKKEWASSLTDEDKARFTEIEKAIDMIIKNKVPYLLFVKIRDQDPVMQYHCMVYEDRFKNGDKLHQTWWDFVRTQLQVLTELFPFDVVLLEQKENFATHIVRGGQMYLFEKKYKLQEFKQKFGEKIKKFFKRT